MRIEDFHVPTPPPGAAELPSDDGEPMETQRHYEQMHLLVGTLQDAWRDRDDFFAAGNMFVYYSEPQAREAQRRGTTRFRGPDVFVVLDTDRRERTSWVAWEERGKLPDVIIELTSPTTESIDRHEKMELYARTWRTGAYFLYDPLTHRLEGYELDARGRRYRRMKPLPSGDLPVRSLGLALGVRELPCSHLPPPSLRWIDADGTPLPTGGERAERAEARVRELEAELARRRVAGTEPPRPARKRRRPR